jgi:demethylmenaquinone methyltransferase/2-methoxy-6-polyprenyl-1,4-benzoquinol methylase
MRILESAPRRYELGIRLLSLGGVGRAYDRLAARIAPGQRVLDVGCGTGALGIRAARRGASVKGIDVNAGMLEVAKRRADEAGLADRLELAEMGVAELDSEPSETYDVVTAGLCLSELSEDERAYALAQVWRVLKPGGLLLVADEVKPRGRLGRLAHTLVRAPLVALTYLVTQQTTHALTGLPEMLEAAGFEVLSMRKGGLGGLAEVVARKPAGDAS